MTLKDIVLQYRQENNLSQREFAAKCNLSNVVISIIEKDKVNPKTGKKTVTSIETCAKIADGMGISLNDLMAKLDNNIPIRLSFPQYRQSVSPEVIDMIDSAIDKKNMQKAIDGKDLKRLEALHQNPRLGLLFDMTTKMNIADVEYMLRFADGILKERNGDD